MNEVAKWKFLARLANSQSAAIAPYGPELVVTAMLLSRKDKRMLPGGIRVQNAGGVVIIMIPSTLVGAFVDAQVAQGIAPATSPTATAPPAYTVSATGGILPAVIPVAATHHHPSYPTYKIAPPTHEVLGDQTATLAPDAIDPILAWRAWRIDEYGNLYSANRGAAGGVGGIRWPARDTFKATCLRYGSDNALMVSSHKAPVDSCTCGIYGAREYDLGKDYLSDGSDVRTAAIGKVALWGRVITHQHGWRAECAYPKVLFMFAGKPSPHRVAARVERRYGIPCRVVERDDLLDMLVSEELGEPNALDTKQLLSTLKTLTDEDIKNLLQPRKGTP